MLIQEHGALGEITFTHTHPKHNYTAASIEYTVLTNTRRGILFIYVNFLISLLTECIKIWLV